MTAVAFGVGGQVIGVFTARDITVVTARTGADYLTMIDSGDRHPAIDGMA